MLRRMKVWANKHRAVIAFLILAVPTFFAITVSSQAANKAQRLGEQNRELTAENHALTVHVDAKDNETRCQVVGLVALFTANSRRSYRATLASPFATADQKAVAQRNLAAVTAGLVLTEKQLGHPTGAACAIDAKG